MFLHMILSLQGVSAAGIPADFDLAKVPRAKDPAEILVIGRRQRITPEEQSMEPPLGRAEIPLFGKAKAALHAEGAALAGGATSQRVMMTIRLPF